MFRKIFAAGLLGFLALSGAMAGERDAAAPPQARCSEVRAPEAPFRCHFFELDKVAYVYPLGQLNGGHREALALGLSLVQIKPSVIEAGGRVAVFAPADMALVRYAHYRFGADAPEWTLVFRVDDRLSITFGALREPPRKIIDATARVPAATPAEFPSAIKAPVLGLYPTSGQIASPAQEALLRDGLADFELIHLPTPYHMVHLLYPEECTREVLRFCAEHDRRDQG